MSATNTTTNLGLSQFVNTDVPAWRQDYNGDMLKIDNAYTADISGATAETSADPSDYMKFYDVSATTNKKILISDLLKGAKVEDLTDTDISTPVDDDGLVYDSTSQKWENVPITTKEQWKKNGAYNRLPLELYAPTSSAHGITYTVNADGSVSTSSTEKDSTNEPFVLFSRSLGYTVPAGQYCFCGKPSASKYRMQLLCTRNGGLVTLADLDNGTTSAIATIQEGDALQVSLTVKSGETGGDTFYPLLTSDLNATNADFVTPAKTNRELTNLPNGLGTIVDIKSYNSDSNVYTCPSDGYIRYAAVGNAAGYVVVCGNTVSNTAYLIAGPTKAINSDSSTVLRGGLYVRKGMKVYCGGTPAEAYFIPLV